MPWGDRTGPIGFGPGSGRQLGYCAGFSGPGFQRARFGQGRVGGRGRGRGFRRMFCQTGVPSWRRGVYAGCDVDYFDSVEEEMAFLQRQAAALETQLGKIKEQLENLEKENNND